MGHDLSSYLPKEVLRQIFYYCSGRKEVENLALTNKLLFSVYDDEMVFNLDRLRLEFLNGGGKERLSRLLELYDSNSGKMMTYDQYFVNKNLMYKDAYTDKLPEVPMEGECISSMFLDIPRSRDMIIDEESEEEIAQDDIRPIQAKTLAKFKSRISKLLKENMLAGIVLDTLFDFNKSSKIKFIIAGGFVLHCITGCGSCDIDIFCINNGEDENSVDIALKKILANIEVALKEKSIPYRVLKTNGTLNILPMTYGERPFNKYPDSATKENQLNIQFVLRMVYSIEELMCFFDIDACRFSFDGEKVFTILEGLRALQYNMNFIGREHIKTFLYYDRAVKYRRRGFATFSVDFHHPLQHNLHIQPFVTWLRWFFVDHYQEGDPCVDESDDYYSGNSNWDEYSTLAPYMFVHFDPDSNDYTNRGMDEDNYYTVILRSLDYWLVDKFCNYPIRNVLDSLWEVCYSDSRYIGSVKNIEISNTVDAGDKEIIESIATHIEKHDVHYFCKDLSELLQRNQAIFITEGYLDSHLMKKYKYYKCYICGKYSHITKPEENECNSDFCFECHKFNQKAKSLHRDLSGKVAIVTGSRAKIGYETALLLLRMKCTVVATSRFATNAFDKFKLEKDFSDWKDLLLVYPLNLKDGKSVMDFIEYIKSKFKHVDIIINNAAQTVRKPVSYYQPLIEIELNNCDKNPLPLSLPSENKAERELVLLTNNLVEQSIKCTKEASLPEDLSYIPTKEKDRFGEYVDNRKFNTWNQLLTDISTIELVEAQMINSVAPTLIVSNLQHIMTPDYENADNESNPNDSLALGYSFIINVSSHEGQFNTTGKTDNHIHTNTSKASLNMLTRSGANQFAKNGILMNSVDTGWVSSAIKTFKDPALKCEDAAYRILYPILSGSLVYGKLYKDYNVVDW